MRIGTTELLIILAVVIIIFGPKQIPKLTKMFGKSIKGFQEGLEGDGSGKDAGTSEDDKAE